MCNNTAFRCYNLTEEQCRAHSLTTGISDVIIATVCFSLVVGVLGRWKKDAWNSQVKRTSLVISFFLVISLLNFALAALYLLPSGYCKVVVFIYLDTKFMIFLYMVAMLGMLLIKIGSPVISRKCTCEPWSHLALFEVVTHVFIFFPSLIFAVVEVFSDHTVCDSSTCATKNLYQNVTFPIFVMSFVVLFILGSVFFLIFVYIRFFRKVRITKRMKWQLFKFSILLMLLVVVLAFEISFYGVLQETNSKHFIGHFTINFSFFLEFAFIVTAMAMLYLPSSRCCKMNQSDSHRPLLSNIHPTNPPSVWNHRNTPSSTTVYNPPPEMSDYMSQNAE